MIRFATKTLALAAIVLGIFTTAFFLIPHGRIGDVYARVTSPQQYSLATGTSRAAQAVNPQTINAGLKGFYTTPIYNFSFHLDASSYNEVYEQAIYKKLAPHKQAKSFFVLTVDPWALRKLDSIPKELDLKSCSANPNLEYLIENFSRSWFSPLPTHSFVNKYGRTEVDYVPKTKEEWEKRTSARLAAYRDMAEKYKYDIKSQHVLERLIENLKKRGDVYIVRIPTSRPMTRLELSVCPNFSKTIKQVAQKHNVRYFDFSNDDYATTDGNHLTQNEGNRFSRNLSDSISLYLRNKKQRKNKKVYRKNEKRTL